jgi:hypothetical protein
MFKARGSTFCGHAAPSAIKPTAAYCVSAANARRNAPSTILANDSATAASLTGSVSAEAGQEARRIKPAAHLIGREIAAPTGGWPFISRR